MKMLSHVGSQIVLTAQRFICEYFLQLKTTFFYVKVNDRKVVIIFAATVLLGKSSKDVMAAFIPSEL